MSVVDVTIPRLAESISEAVLVEWLRDDGAPVKTDEPIATLETDKAAVEIAATESGVLHHARKPGDRVLVGDVIARIDPGAMAVTASPKTAAPDASPSSVSATIPAPEHPTSASAPAPPAGNGGSVVTQSPAVRRLVEEHQLAAGAIPATGRGGRLLKEDVLRHLETRPVAAVEPATPVVAPVAPVAPAAPAREFQPGATNARDDERIVPIALRRSRSQY